ncbi:MAG: peptidase M54 [Acidobacteriota bacterium]
MTDVHLWWIGADAPDNELLDDVRRHVEVAFGVRARHYRHTDRPVHAFDHRRGQHSSTEILRWLVQRGIPAGRVLAITDGDLFIPILTFVYGEAQLGGAAAVVSTARLWPDPDVRPDPVLLRARAVKECLHELGHTFGLLHCPLPQCVMSRSVNVTEVDAKLPVLCSDCVQRYREQLPRKGELP